MNYFSYLFDVKIVLLFEKTEKEAANGTFKKLEKIFEDKETNFAKSTPFAANISVWSSRIDHKPIFKIAFLLFSLFLSINAESTHLLCKGKYHCTANLIFYWVGFNQTSTKCDDNFNTTKLLNPNCKTTD